MPTAIMTAVQTAIACCGPSPATRGPRERHDGDSTIGSQQRWKASSGGFLLKDRHGRSRIRRPYQAGQRERGQRPADGRAEAEG